MALEDLFDMSDCTLDNYCPLLPPPFLLLPLQEQEQKEKRLEAIDLRPFYRTKQVDVAHKLGMSASNLSKQWRAASNQKQWPYRKLLLYEAKINKTRDYGKKTRLRSKFERLRSMHVQINVYS